MRTATIQREKSDAATADAGMFGTLTTDDGFTCKSGELPWRDNAPGKSCIPAGTYTAMWQQSPTKGWCYHLQRVPGRANILIHAANWMGDAEKGLKCELLGCIATGRLVGQLAGQKAILASKAALKDFEDHMQRQTFVLTIKEAK